MRVAVLIGLQAAGKSSFYRAVLAGTHVQVSKDHFPRARNRQRRQQRLIEEALAAGRDVAVDNTNPAPEDRRPIVELAHAWGAEVVAYWFPPDPVGPLERNAVREGKTRVPEVGVRATLARLRAPGPDEGFDARYVVRFDGAGGFVVQTLSEG
ncbi:AAA family ATPase [Embleya sp. NPDC127516]|uniref:AAA family ATPase n=1 Tax=Embleya sp. NPDC127516 TaxID=3363990 RepID=UPI00380D5F72